MTILWLSLALVASIAWLAFILCRIRQRETNAIAKFNLQPKSSDSAFLADLGLEPNSRDAFHALQLRGLIADLGSVPTDRIHATTKFYPDMQNLPYYDSPDSLDVVFRIEKLFKVRISGDEANELVTEAMENCTVREFVLGWINYLGQGRGCSGA